MRGNEAVEDCKESGAIKHLTLKEVAGLTRLAKNGIFKNRAEALLGEEVKSESSLTVGPNIFVLNMIRDTAETRTDSKIIGGGEVWWASTVKIRLSYFAEIAKRLEAKKGWSRKKLNRFYRLLIVPFGSRIDDWWA